MTPCDHGRSSVSGARLLKPLLVIALVAYGVPLLPLLITSGTRVLSLPNTSNTQMTSLNGTQSTSATSYLSQEVLARPNLQVLLHARVTRVLQTEKNDFRTVDFRNGDGKVNISALTLVLTIVV